MQNDKIMHLRKDLSLSSEGYLTKTPRKEGSDLVPTSDKSEGKVIENPLDDQITDSGVRFSIRKEEAPKKTGVGYKVFVL